MQELVDLFVIGGGINGAGIARDAAGRGLTVMLCEKNDLACGTSSASTKLIHGGLRYLEHYEFRLVREALIEREVLLKSAPHIVSPMRFVLPHHKGLRPALLISLGLFLYDHLGGRAHLPASQTVNLNKDAVGTPLKADYVKGFAYSDCWVDDARLVILNALDAKERGAQIEVGTTFETAERKNDLWEIKITDSLRHTRTCMAKAIINAAGPWLTDVLEDIQHTDKKHSLKLVKGSHIVVNKMFPGEHAYLFQHPDGRVVFAIPYLQKYTLIGTTDVVYQGAPEAAVISAEEIEYLCNAINEYFSQPISADDIIWHYAGVRPLYEDGSVNASTTTRDYMFDLRAPDGAAPLLSIYGGKLTTYRKLAEHALAKLADYLPMSSTLWTDKASLPGGDIENADFGLFKRRKADEYAWLPEAILHRMLLAYGTRIDLVLGDAKSTADLGIHFGHGLYEAEVIYLIEHEWARTIDDILWRRTKLGIGFLKPELEKLQQWISKYKHDPAMADKYALG